MKGFEELSPLSDVTGSWRQHPWRGSHSEGQFSEGGLYQEQVRPLPLLHASRGGTPFICCETAEAMVRASIVAGATSRTVGCMNFKKKLGLFYVSECYASLYICVASCVKDSCKLSCGHGESNPSPLQEQ